MPRDFQPSKAATASSCRLNRPSDGPRARAGGLWTSSSVTLRMRLISMILRVHVGVGVGAHVDQVFTGHGHGIVAPTTCGQDGSHSFGGLGVLGGVKGPASRQMGCQPQPRCWRRLQKMRPTRPPLDPYDQAFWVHLLVHPLGFVLGVGLHASEAVEPAMGPGIKPALTSSRTSTRERSMKTQMG